MDGKEIFNEIMQSPRLKEMLNVPDGEEICEDFESGSQYKEVTVIRNIIEGQVRHTSDDNIFKNITKLFDL
jgi:hypothetical protein